MITVFACTDDGPTKPGPKPYVPSSDVSKFMPMKTGNWWVYDVVELDMNDSIVRRHLDSFVVVSTNAVVGDGGEYLLHQFRNGEFHGEHRIIVTPYMVKEVLPNFWDYEGFVGYTPSLLGIVLRNEHTWLASDHRYEDLSWSNSAKVDYSLVANATRKIYDLSKEMDKEREDPDPTLWYPGFIEVTTVITDTVKNDSPSGTFWDGYSQYTTTFEVDRHLAEGVGVFYENTKVMRQHISGKYLQLSRTLRFLLSHHTS